LLSFKQLSEALSRDEQGALEKLLKKNKESDVGYTSGRGGNPDDALDDAGYTKRAPAPGTATMYRQEYEQGGASGFLGGFLGKALQYGSDFATKHGYTPIAAKIEPAKRTYDPEASIKANEKGGDIRKQMAIEAKAKKEKIDTEHKADMKALMLKKSGMDPAIHAAKVQELNKRRQAKIGALAKETGVLNRQAKGRAAHLRQYYGFKGKGQDVTPDTDRGYEGGYERA
jgi:hypothetical protein